MNPDLPDQAANAAPIADRHEWGTAPGIYIPQDLDRALHIISINRHENLILQYIRWQSWSRGRDGELVTVPCLVSPSLLSRVTGLAREKLSLARTALVRDRILLAVPPDSHVINPDVDNWSAGRITLHSLSYARTGKGVRPAHVDPPMEKKKIPGRLRTRVFERDAYRCLKCGDHQGLAADHITPESLGGETTLDNLQTLCKRCNSEKRATEIDYRKPRDGSAIDHTHEGTVAR